DSAGKLVRSLSSREKKEAEQPPEWPDQVKEVTTIPASTGMNRYAWNLRWEPPIKIPGAFYSGNGPEGPLVLPGKYTVKLSVGSQSQSQPLEIVQDPRVKNVSQSDVQKQFDLLMEIREANTELHRSVNQKTEEHTSELQSPCNLVCRLLLEKKKNKIKKYEQINYY